MYDIDQIFLATIIIFFLIIVWVIIIHFFNKFSGNQLYGPRSRHIIDSIGSRKHKVRLPRKSRLGLEQRRQKRRERKRKKKSRKERLLSSE